MKNSFTMHLKYGEQIALLTDAQAGILFRAIIAYYAENDLPKMDEITQIVFVSIRQEIDEEKQKNQMLSLVRKQAGSKGGRPPKSLINKGNKAKKPNAYFGFDEEKLSLLENGKESTKEKDKGNTLVKEEEKARKKLFNNNLTASARMREGNCYEDIISHYAGEIDDETKAAIWKYIQFFQAKTGCFILNEQLKTFLRNVNEYGLMFEEGVLGCLNQDGIGMAMQEMSS